MKKRTIIQIIFFVLIAAIVANHYLEETGRAIPFLSSVSLHAICPFGGVETLYSLIVHGVYVAKIHSSSLILFVIIMLGSVLFGPILCGYICPLGSIQEWMGKVGKKIFGKEYNQFVPKKIDNALRYLRYISLITVLVLTAKTLTLVFLNVDPYYALFHFYSGEVAIGALIVLGSTLILSLFVERPWCKYACPYGALLGLSNLIRIYPIKRNANTCIDCRACDDICPMNIKVSESRVIRDHQCISCYQCTSEAYCPVPETVQIMLAGRGTDDAS
jgi:polyferredoxin